LPDNSFARVILDAPAYATSVGDISINGDKAVLKLEADDTLHIIRKKPVRGLVKPHEMREWNVVLTEQSNRWLVYRQDKQDVIVTCDNLEVDCHGITTDDGTLHCDAEMLVVGQTNRAGKFVDAKRVHLRTLSQYDQVVNVPLIAWSETKATAPS